MPIKKLPSNKRSLRKGPYYFPEPIASGDSGNPAALSATVTHFDQGANEGVQNLPATVTADSEFTNILVVTGSSTAGGDVTVSFPSGLPDNVTTGVWTTSAQYIQFSGWTFPSPTVYPNYVGTHPSEGTYNITCRLQDTHGNATNKNLILVKREVWPKAIIKLHGARKQGTTWDWVQNGANSENVTGTVTLEIMCADITYKVEEALTDCTVQWYKNGVAWGSPQAGNATKSWDTTTEANKPFVIEIKVISAGGAVPGLEMQNLSAYRNIPSLFRVGNGSAPAAPYDVPANDLWLRQIVDTQISYNASAGVDYVEYTGTHVRRTDTHPYPHAAAQKAVDAGDQTAMKTATNWVIESLNHHRNTWFDNVIPVWYRDSNEIPYVGGFFPRIDVNTEGSVGTDRKQPWFDGKRGDNCISSYSTFAGIPGQRGWLGMQIDGRVYHLKETGEVVTVAGWSTPASSTSTFWEARQLGNKGEDSRTISNFWTANGATNKGDWSGYVATRFDSPNDLAFHYDWPTTKIVYVADTERHRIAQITFSDTSFSGAVITTYKDLSGYAADAEPYSLVVMDDGVIFYADRNRNEVVKIAASAGAITKLCDFDFAQVIRRNSLGQLIVGSPVKDQATYNNTGSSNYHKGRVSRVNASTGAITDLFVPTSTYPFQGYISAEPGGLNAPTWMWLDVDRWGSIGPTNTIYVASSISAEDSTYGLEGSRSEWAAIYVDGSGDMTSIEDFHGTCNNGTFYDGKLENTSILDPWGHYVWAVTVHPNECRYISTGFGGLGVSVFRRILTDPNNNYSADNAYYARGLIVWQRGTVVDWPLDSRPSFANIHGRNGYNLLGANFRTFDELNDLNDADLTTAIQAGLDGSIARPEITGDDLRDLIFYIRKNSLDGQMDNVRPGSDAADTTNPTISNIQATGGSGQFQVTWTTNESCIGFVEYGPTDYYGLWKLESAFATSHDQTVTSLITGTVHYRVVAKDSAGNITRSSDATVVVS